MNETSKVAFRALTPVVLALPLGLAAGCGGEARDPVAAELVAPEAREAKVTLTPALEVSFDEAIADRMVIEDIRLNLGDVRLLGADPRIPVGGLPLLETSRVVEAFGDRAGLDLPFPSRFLDDEDLAVYLRIDRTEQLEGAAVIVRARLYKESAPSAEAQSLIADTHGATDPDGDPACDHEDPVGATDPDGDPALPPEDCDGATDPDGDPALPGSHRSGLVLRGEYQPYVTVELRDDHSADLVASLSDPSATDVVVGIPASRWFTPELIAHLDAALEARVRADLERGEEVRDARETIVIRTSRHENRAAVEGRADDYFLSDAENLERLTVRR